MPQAKYFFWTFATWEVGWWGWGAEPPPTGPQKKFSNPGYSVRKFSNPGLRVYGFAGLRAKPCSSRA